MKSTNPIDELVERILSSLPKDASILRQDMEKHLHTLINTTLRKLDLVTREEFEVQRAVLARTREQLAELEAQIMQLEGQRGAPLKDGAG